MGAEYYGTWPLFTVDTWCELTRDGRVVPCRVVGIPGNVSGWWMPDYTVELLDGTTLRVAASALKPAVFEEVAW